MFVSNVDEGEAVDREGGTYNNNISVLEPAQHTQHIFVRVVRSAHFFLEKNKDPKKQPF